jgi:AraC-like DNA-binding protein
MRLPLHPSLVPPHIDGFVLRTDGRISRFSAVGAGPGAAGGMPRVAERGRSRGLLGDRHYVLEPQHMLWLKPGQNRLLLDVSDDFLAWVLVFRPRVVRRVLRSPSSRALLGGGERTHARERARGKVSARAGTRDDEVISRKLSRTEVRELSRLFASLPVGAGRDVFNAGLGYALARAVLAFNSAEPVPQRADVHKAVRKAVLLLREGHTELSNVDLASRAGISANRLSRLFSRETGTTLVDFRNRQRIERCLRALAAPEPPELTELALDVGFGSYTQFHRVFKQRVGMAPVRFLRLQRAAGSRDLAPKHA